MNNSELQTYLCSYKRLIEEGKSKESAIRVASNKIVVKEENSNKILVYVGTYKVDKYLTKSIESLTYEGNPKAKFKRYIDIETYTLYTVNMPDVKKFEEENNIIYRQTNMNNMSLYYQNYMDARKEFFEGILSEPQDKVVLKLTRKDQE